MQTARDVVEQEIERVIPNLEDLPEQLRPVLSRHYRNLFDLAESLAVAGRDHATIRMMVATLLRSYETDLLAALEEQR